MLESIPATLTCWSFGMSSQSKQQRVSPVRNRLPFSASMSFTLKKGQGQCQADEVIFTSVLWGVSCNIFDVWVFSALQHSLGEDGSHSVLARVVPLQQHVLELRVHILNLLVHLLENQGYWQHAITSYLIYTIVLIVHYLRWRGCVHPGCSSWCASRSSRSRAPPPRCRSKSAAGLPRSSTWNQTLPKAQQTQGLSAFTKVTSIGSDRKFS